MLKRINFRIYPNNAQKILFAKTFGCCRLVYNKALDLRKTKYKEEGKSIGYGKTSAELTKWKGSEKYSFLREVDSVALRQSLKDLDVAYDRFFKKLGNYPRFKSKHDNHKSYRTSGYISIIGKYIRLPKVGCVKIKQSMEINNIHSVTVKQVPSGKYYVSILFDFEPEFKQNNGKRIGLGVGLKEFYTDSNGNTVHNPKFFEKNLNKIKREQRKLSRKQKGSKNRQKQRIRFAKAHEKVVNKRNDFLQKESTKLVRENQIICVEDLDIKGMLQNHKLAKAISSASWYKFFAMLEYKSKWYGCTLIKVPTFYPPSQLCSTCGYKNPLVKNLSVRQWECPRCGEIHDRDKNVSINILYRRTHGN